MNLVINKIYTDIDISIDDFLEDSVEENDPVKEYILARLTDNKKQIDYGKLQQSTVLTYLKCMEWIYENLEKTPKKILEECPKDIKKYVDFIISGYYGTYCCEDVEMVGLKNNASVRFSKSQINI